MKLTTKTAHIWLQNIQEIDDKRLSQLEANLSSKEKARAKRFLHKSDRKRSIIAYGLLRQILSYYLDKLPKSFKFSTNAHGKPCLENSEIQFNLSHSKDFVLWGFTKDQEIGVDIEYAKRSVEVLTLAKRFFSPKEYQALVEETEEGLLTAFYRCWTRKEAFIKAVGEGLSYPLDAFAVDIRAEIKKSALMSVKNRLEAAPEWSLLPIVAPQHYESALAIAGDLEKIEYYQPCKIR